MKGSVYIVAIGALVGVFVTIKQPVLLSILAFLLILLCGKIRISSVVSLLSLAIMTYMAIITPRLIPEPVVAEGEHPITFKGTILSSPVVEEDYVQFDLESAQSGHKWKVYVPDSLEAANVQSGATCTFKGIEQPVSIARNPGEFDYRSFLQHKGYKGSIRVTSSIACEGQSLLTPLHQWRQKRLNELQEQYSVVTASWIMTLLLGDDSLLADEKVELFQRWNLSHLLAISGLHVGLSIAILSFIAIRFGWLTKEWLKIFLLILLPMYAVIAGGAPSVLRAVSMAEMALLLTFTNVRIPLVDVLSATMILFLLINPLIAFQLGFQFSFLVTFALILSKKLVPPSLSPFLISIRISMISQLALLPIQVHQFYTFNPLSLVANIFLVPLFSVVLLPFCMMLFLLLLLPSSIHSLLDQVFQTLIFHIEAFLQWLDRHLYVEWVIGELSVYIIVLYFGAFVLFMMCWERQKLRQSFLASIVMVATLMVHSALPYVSDNGRVTVLDVGQGDTIIIEWPYREHVLMVDAAGKLFGDEGEVFRYHIKPYLHSRGIKEVNTLLLSHNDQDHVGSAKQIIEQFQVSHLFVSPYFLLKKPIEDAEVQRVEQGDQLKLAGDTLHVLHPGEEAADKNDNSLVVQGEVGGLTWLFTGDISADMERDLIEQYPSLRVDVLKVAHHGSSTSSDPAFIDHIQPSIALLSVGENNRYGHPTDRVLETLENHIPVILRTDNHGGIIYEFSGEKGTFQTYLP
ncbi:DNA internalization-related competence protein ComEC/Rec2 [Pontibacillus litoralis]|uniref:Competence protein n=1 Tax=Pontibacillus litoralis JSM 072002 TaxID=1385512 RepID=A0A0A5G727_9BACI|nr:DNA internalization-related competence protein ComEC/Rec2 [Pontibacillus litoralis]KGX88936.1 competence protein [Pontibacillus litoralis JSM 072002]